MSVLDLIRSVKCRFMLHPRLDVIQSFGSAQHVGCPFCRREFGIHHGARAVIPWDADLAEMYDFMGYDTEAASARWRRYLP